MESPQTKVEKSVYRTSLWGSVFFALIGIGAYFITHSWAVLIDGIFSLSSTQDTFISAAIGASFKKYVKT